MRNLTDNSGFTLIEMLVAAAVSSIILLMVYTAYSSVIKSVNYGRAAASYYEELNFALRRIDSDISNLYWSADKKDISFICTESAGSSILNFVTAGYRDFRLINSLKEQIPFTDVHETGFYLRKNQDTDSFDIIRRKAINYDDNPLEGGFEEVLLKNVKSLNFEFRYRNDWTPVWDSRETKNIPKAVKTTLVVYNSSRTPEQYVFLSIPNIGSE